MGSAPFGLQLPMSLVHREALTELARFRFSGTGSSPP